MKWSIFKLLLLTCVFPLTLHAQEDKYTKRVQRYENAWQRVIPRYTKVQFAGSMAMLSVGTGWNYYRNHWETDMLLGIVPRNANDHANVTFTLKQNYFPWNIDLGEKVSFEPLCCGIYVNLTGISGPSNRISIPRDIIGSPPASVTISLSGSGSRSN